MKLPRFSLRELFLLVVIAAMGCGWWVDRRHYSNAAETVRELQAERGKNAKLQAQLELTEKKHLDDLENMLAQNAWDFERWKKAWIAENTK